MVAFGIQSRARLLTRILFAAMTVFGISVVSLGQTEPSYQSGTVMKVKVHKPAAGEDVTVKQYDLSIKLKDTVYVVLYTPATGSTTVEYSAGTDRPVLIEGDTMKFSDLMGHTQELPILSRKDNSKKKSK